MKKRQKKKKEIVSESHQDKMVRCITEPIKVAAEFIIKDKRNKVPAIQLLTIIEYGILYKVMMWIINNITRSDAGAVLSFILIVASPLLLMAGNMWLSEIAYNEKWSFEIIDIRLLAYTIVVLFLTVSVGMLHFGRSDILNNINAVLGIIIVISIITECKKSRK